MLTLANEPRLRCYSHIDERCAGFFALGSAKASGLPVAVTCTSGTAAAELAPAAIEAYEARVPLLLLTADRPPELREIGAGQAIDQLKLYGGAAKWFFEVGVLDDAGPARVRWIRTLACRAYWTALQGRPGVVHLNFPLREPLVTDDPLPADTTARSGERPYVRRTQASPGPIANAHAGALATEARAGGGESSTDTSAGVAPGADTGAGVASGETRLAEMIAAAERGVVVAGRHERDTQLGEAAARFCEAAGWPLLADPMSGARRGDAAVAYYDALLRDQVFAHSHRPDLVLRVGDLPVSKPLRAWLAELPDVPQIALDPEGAWQDPAAVLSESLAIEPAAALRQLDTYMRLRGETSADPDWLAGWRAADALAARALGKEIRAGEVIGEPAVAAELGALLPAEATLWVASSMPVRDIETVWSAREQPPRVLCNRGANGIDGTISSAFGAAAVAKAGGGGPVVLLIGDVALAHDLGGLLAATRLDIELTIVLLDNGGGGIFDFLPVARTAMARERDRDIYTEHIATPTGLDAAKVAAVYGLRYEQAPTIPRLRTALEHALAPGAGSALVHVPTDRAENVALHSRMWRAVSQALASADRDAASVE